MGIHNLGIVNDDKNDAMILLKWWNGKKDVENTSGKNNMCLWTNNLYFLVKLKDISTIVDY